MRTDKSQEVGSFLRRYFEPMGLHPDDPVVLKAVEEGRVETKTWEDGWNDEHARRFEGSTNTIDSLNYVSFEGHYLKKVRRIHLELHEWFYQEVLKPHTLTYDLES